MNSLPLWEIVTQTQPLSFQETFNLLGHICFNISAIRLTDSHTNGIKGLHIPKGNGTFLCRRHSEVPTLLCDTAALRPGSNIWHGIERQDTFKVKRLRTDRGNDSRTTVVSSMFNYCWWKGHFVQLTSEGGISEWFPCPGLFDKVYR